MTAPDPERHSKGVRSGAHNPLRRLADLGQSIWLDYVSRKLITSGELQRLVEEDGLTGVTSNPSIFEKAIGGSADYDEAIAAFGKSGDADVAALYEHLAIGDIQAAADVLRPVHDATRGRDGYISLEVSPHLALRTEETIFEARRLWQAVDRPNLMIKVPGTEAGVPAIRTLIAEGINVNVTLLFAQSAYRAVADAYFGGLEARLAGGGEIAQVASVASFFVSRIDTAIDRIIEQRLAAGETSEELRSLRGKIAIANARLAYQQYLAFLGSARWRRLARAGATPQRLLWASTGTKNPTYSDVLYVEELIGPQTVNTMPPATMDAFRDHGRPRSSLTENIAEAREVLAAADRLGLALEGLTRRLVVDGVRRFSEAADNLLVTIAHRRLDLCKERALRTRNDGR